LISLGINGLWTRMSLWQTNRYFKPQSYKTCSANEILTTCQSAHLRLINNFVKKKVEYSLDIVLRACIFALPNGRYGVIETGDWEKGSKKVDIFFGSLKKGFTFALPNGWFGWRVKKLRWTRKKLRQKFGT
jgi:hypothetical protein